jgi:hypothetical protein
MSYGKNISNETNNIALRSLPPPNVDIIEGDAGEQRPTTARNPQR